jgi:hypothetical protein
MRRAYSTLRVVAWLALLIGVIAGFTALGGGRLGGPPLGEPAEWAAWAAGRAPVEVMFALLRLGALGLAWYLLGVSVLGIAVRMVRARRLIAVADVITLPVVRRMLQAALGVSLAGGSLTMNLAGASASEAPPAVEATETSTAAWTWRLTEREVRGEAQPLPSPPSSVPWVARDPAPAPPTAATTLPADQVTQWRVDAGQHFWSIAEHVLRGAWDRQPTDDEIVPYWKELIEENREALADPENPDLIYPGQVFTVPTPPAG